MIHIVQIMNMFMIVGKKVMFSLTSTQTFHKLNLKY